MFISYPIICVYPVTFKYEVWPFGQGNDTTFRYMYMYKEHLSNVWRKSIYRQLNYKVLGK